MIFYFILLKIKYWYNNRIKNKIFNYCFLCLHFLKKKIKTIYIIYLIDAFDTIIDTTKMYDNHCFIYYIGYNGTDEMIHAIKEIVEDSKKNENLQITESVLENHIWSGSLPPVDLVIRTGVDNDHHNSAGFMMWKTANSQYYFTKIKHPDFTNDEFMKAIKDYQNRERRLGK